MRYGSVISYAVFLFVIEITIALQVITVDLWSYDVDFILAKI